MVSGAIGAGRHRMRIGGRPETGASPEGSSTTRAAPPCGRVTSCTLVLEFIQAPYFTWHSESGLAMNRTSLLSRALLAAATAVVGALALVMKEALHGLDSSRPNDPWSPHRKGF